jgi:hypothetical protein
MNQHLNFKVSTTNIIVVEEVARIHDSIVFEIHEIELVKIEIEIIEVPTLDDLIEEFLDLLLEDIEAETTPAQALPVCFRCEADCDHCEDFRECSECGDCDECQYHDDCWEGKNCEPFFALSLPEQITFKPNRPACFDCNPPCKGCTKVDDPKYCLQCSKCNLTGECTVSMGKILRENLNR